MFTVFKWRELISLCRYTLLSIRKACFSICVRSKSDSMPISVRTVAYTNNYTNRSIVSGVNSISLCSLDVFSSTWRRNVLRKIPGVQFSLASRLNVLKRTLQKSALIRPEPGPHLEFTCGTYAVRDAGPEVGQMWLPESIYFALFMHFSELSTKESNAFITQTVPINTTAFFFFVA